jgi:hypothetical protein
MRSSCSSLPSRYRSYVLLPRAVFLSGGVEVLTMATFAPSDYRLLLVGHHFPSYQDSADRIVEALNLKEDLLRGIYAYSTSILIKR